MNAIFNDTFTERDAHEAEQDAAFLEAGKRFPEDDERCLICGGNAGRLMPDGSHAMCTELAKRDLSTPKLERCPDCNGVGYKPKSRGLSFIISGPGGISPVKIDRALKTWAPKCKTCDGKGLQNAKATYQELGIVYNKEPD